MFSFTNNKTILSKDQPQEFNNDEDTSFTKASQGDKNQDLIVRSTKNCGKERRNKTAKKRADETVSLFGVWRTKRLRSCFNFEWNTADIS